MMRERRIRPIWLLWCACAGFVACGGKSHENGVGGETNWLRACGGDSECAVGRCVCGLCSEGCAEDAECPEGLRCETRTSTLYESACGESADVRGLCAPACGADAECGTGRVCAGGACRPDPSPSPNAVGSAGQGAGGAALGGDGPRLLVDAHLDLTAQCLPDLDKPIGSGAATFDISPSGFNSSPNEECKKPYMLVLRVANPFQEDVLVTGYEVELMSVQRERIVFNRLAPELPNPFSLRLTASVPPRVGDDDGASAVLAEAIPTGYAEQLDQFIGGQVAIRVQLEAETLSGAPVAANPFEYRVALCWGCLTMCGSAVEAPISGVCGDGAGADGRYCIDDEC